jgi:hypothetical protein
MKIKLAYEFEFSNNGITILFHFTIKYLNNRIKYLFHDIPLHPLCTIPLHFVCFKLFKLSLNVHLLSHSFSLSTLEHVAHVEFGFDIIVCFFNPNISGFEYHLRNLIDFLPAKEKIMKKREEFKLFILISLYRETLKEKKVKSIVHYFRQKYSFSLLFLFYISAIHGSTL